MQQLTETSPADTGTRIHTPRAVVVIGVSTGGPATLTQILPKFPRDFQASVVIVQQMRPGFTKLLAQHLNELSALHVEEAERSQFLTPGSAVIVRGDCRAAFELSSESLSPMCVLNVENVSTSADLMRNRLDNAMSTAARIFGPRTIGVLLTGIGDSGRHGMKEIRDCGGRTVAQDEASSVVFDMPRNSIDAGVVDEILPLWSISDRIIEMVGEI
jgi:two-component system chemotaxis response regulator CheB